MRSRVPGRVIAQAMLVGVVVSAVVTAVSHVGVLVGWERRAVDVFLFFRERLEIPEIVLVVIDDDSFEALGARQPLPRHYLAELADFLLRSGARVVALDVILKTPSVADEDAALVTAARRWAALGRPLVVATLAVPAGTADPIAYVATPPFAADLAAVVGFANAPEGRDGIIRNSIPLLPTVGGGYIPSLALSALAVASGLSPGEIAATLRGDPGRAVALPIRTAGGGLGDMEPVTLGALAEGRWRIDYAGPPGTLTSFPSRAIVELARSGVTPDPDNPFQGKIVLVGATFTDSRDFFPTPVGRMPGVEIHANIAHTLLARRVLQPPPWLLNIGLLVAACVAVSLLSLWWRPVWVTVAAGVLVAGFALLSYEAYTQGGYWLDFVGPVLGVLGYLQVARFVSRRRVAAAFGQYVSPAVLEQVLTEGARLGGEVRTVSVIMSDLRGFTTLSERLSPAEITELMNEYMAAMVEAIVAHRGMVNDFIGDGILACFGAPSNDPDHAWHAVLTALDMQAALARLNGKWQAERRPPLAMGIAVNTGDVFAGTVGSARRKKYAVMGDPVNTVSRIEGQNRELGTSILISASTLAAVKNRVVVRDRGTVTLKGKAKDVELFELLDVARGTSPG